MAADVIGLGALVVETNPAWLVPAIIAGFAIGFPLFWYAVVWFLSLAGGWQRLARDYAKCFPSQLKKTTMDPRKRTLLRVTLDDAMRAATAKSVEQLMGNKPEERFLFISERAEFVTEEGLDI